MTHDQKYARLMGVAVLTNLAALAALLCACQDDGTGDKAPPGPAVTFIIHQPPKSGPALNLNEVFPDGPCTKHYAEAKYQGHEYQCLKTGNGWAWKRVPDPAER